MNYLDLFAGIGGFALGLKRAGAKINRHYFSEIDGKVSEIYTKHFPDAIPLGDIRTVDPAGLGRVDLVTFGFPCQDLSVAGKQAGLQGERSCLFFEAMRLIKALRPRVFVFENVKGLLTSRSGADFAIVLQAIADLGIYECGWQLVNTSWLLPQNRERVYFVGYVGGEPRPEVFPISENDFEDTGIHGQSANTITSRTGHGETVGAYVVERELVQKTKKDIARIQS